MIESSVQCSSRQFTASDRCDRCGARATVQAVLHGGGELFFCGHHARVHGGVLERVAVCFEGGSEPALAAAA